MKYSRIEHRHLRHFVALSEELHFGRAAKRCGISQPPFSMSIRQLENCLGFPLVERTSHEVRLTAAGSAFYKDAIAVLTQIRRAADTAARVNAGLEGSLRIGFFTSMMHRGLSRAIHRFEQEFPAIELKLVELSMVEQIPAIRSRHITYGFVADSAVPSGLASDELIRERFVLCVPMNHSAPTEGPVPLKRFRDESFILLSRDLSPTYYDHVISWCVVEGFHPSIKYELRSWSSVLSCVSKGMGVTLVPRGLMNSSLPGVRFLDLGRTAVDSVICGAWLESEDANMTLRTWRSMVKLEISNDVRDSG